MTNHEPRIFENLNDQSDFYQQNREILAASELGLQLVEVYDLIIDRYPQLITTKIIPMASSPHADVIITPAAVAPWSEFNSSGQPEVVFPTTSLVEEMAASEAILDAIPGGRRLVAESWGIEPEELTSKMDQIGTFIHELGHTLEDAELTEEIYIERMLREGEELPLGPVTASSLVTPGTEQYQWLEENGEAVAKELGLQTSGELVQLQFAAYLELSWEAYANNFTTEIIATMSPSLRAGLTAR